MRGLLGTIRAVRDANRREDVWVDRIFTLVGARENSRVVEYGVDSEEHFDFAKHPGDVYLATTVRWRAESMGSIGWPTT